MEVNFNLYAGFFDLKILAYFRAIFWLQVLNIAGKGPKNQNIKNPADKFKFYPQTIFKPNEAKTVDHVPFLDVLRYGPFVKK